jgi:hypothetical protein
MSTFFACKREALPVLLTSETCTCHTRAGGFAEKSTIQCLQPGPADNINARCCRSGGGQRHELAQVLCRTARRLVATSLDLEI